MIYLKKMAELLNRREGVYDTGYQNAENIFASLQVTKVFVIMPPVTGARTIPAEKPDLDKNLPFTLPFESCWFEVYDGAVGTFDSGGRTFAIEGILIDEVKPGTFNYAVYMVEPKTGQEMVMSGYDGMEYDGVPWANKFLCNLITLCRFHVLKILEEMNTINIMGLASTNDRIKLKTKSGKILHKIRKIIYIVPKKERGQQIPGTGTVDWTHRWMVRGHWRRHEGLGKNRAGEYCIQNFTWVTEHEKGPEDAPLVSDKVRVMKGDSDARRK
jgi:hypothetical protein